MNKSRRDTGYKDLTLQQIRSFFYTVELGSFSAAAKKLGLSHPTVWHQVHALQTRLGTKLVSPSRVGCRITSAGRILANLIAPIVHSTESLAVQFNELIAKQRPSLTIATTPRIILEDIPLCLRRFRIERPDVDLVIHETTNQNVTKMVAEGEAHLGIGYHALGSDSFDKLKTSKAYDLDIGLFLPEGHRLAAKPIIKAADLKGEIFLNRTESLRSVEWDDFMRRNGLRRSGGSCSIQAEFAATLVHYVREGYGVAFTVLNTLVEPPDGIVVKQVTHLLGKISISFIRRHGTPMTDQELAFCSTLQQIYVA